MHLILASPDVGENSHSFSSVGMGYRRMILAANFNVFYHSFSSGEEPIMKALLVYPAIPDTFWSFKHILKFIHRRPHTCHWAC